MIFGSSLLFSSLFHFFVVELFLSLCFQNGGGVLKNFLLVILLIFYYLAGENSSFPSKTEITTAKPRLLFNALLHTGFIASVWLAFGPFSVIVSQRCTWQVKGVFTESGQRGKLISSRNGWSGVGVHNIVVLHSQLPCSAITSSARYKIEQWSELVH